MGGRVGRLVDLLVGCFDCASGERVRARDDDVDCVRGEMAGTAPWSFVVAVCLMELYSHVEGVDRTRMPLAYRWTM